MAEMLQHVLNVPETYVYYGNELTSDQFDELLKWMEEFEKSAKQIGFMSFSEALEAYCVYKRDNVCEYCDGCYMKINDIWKSKCKRCGKVFHDGKCYEKHVSMYEC